MAESIQAISAPFPVKPITSFHEKELQRSITPVEKDTLSSYQDEKETANPIDKLIDLLLRYNKCLAACIQGAKKDQLEALDSYQAETKRKQTLNNSSAVVNLIGGVVGGGLTAASGINTNLTLLKSAGEFVPHVSGTIAKVVQGSETITDGNRQAVLSGSLPSAKQLEDHCEKAGSSYLQLLITIMQARAGAMRI